MNLTPEQINAIIDARMLSSVDGINSTLSNAIDIFLGIFSTIAIVISFVTVIGYFKRKKIVEEVLLEVNKEIDKDKTNIIQNVEAKAYSRIENSIQKYKEQSQAEEYYRNMMFKDLSNMLATELHFNKSNNLKEVFSIHAERLGVVTNLTSGREKETIRAINQLSTGTYEIIKMESFKMSQG